VNEKIMCICAINTRKQMHVMHPDSGLKYEYNYEYKIEIVCKYEWHLRIHKVRVYVRLPLSVW
jgi:predicted RNA methylase